jgi:DNA-binding CsgD family transcriptional regulator
VTRLPDAPRHVVTTTGEATVILRALVREGWQTREGFALPDPSWDVSNTRLVLYGRVTDLDTVQLAVLAAARGAGIVAVADPADDTGRALLDDLRRLGPVSTGGPGGDNDPVARLIPEQRALLERLAAGDTIAAAAAAEFLSLRTANRRIAESRTLLGVRTTREAVLAYLRQRRPE